MTGGGRGRRPGPRPRHREDDDDPAQLAGFTAVRVTSNWLPGLAAPTSNELTVLRNIEGAARLSGVKVYVSVYHPGSRTTPLEPTAQAQFARYAAALAESIPTFDDIIVGNEPNLNRFWLPQFGLDGANASAPAYLSLLARTYDALKAVDPGLRVWGGALAPRGGDRPGGARPTSSPTAFIQTMGTAYRASGRTSPVMDGLAIHPYPDNSSQSPDFPHPRSTSIGLADYEKLVAPPEPPSTGRRRPARRCRSCTTSSGSSRPSRKEAEPLLGDRARDDEAGGRVEASGGVRSGPPARVLPAERGGNAPLPLARREGAAQLAVGGVLRGRLPEGQPLRGARLTRPNTRRLDCTVRRARARRRLKNVRFPGQAEFLRGKRDVRFRCTLDCAWEVVATRTTTGATAARVRGYGRWGRAIVATLRNRKLGRAPVRLTLTVTHPVNPGVPATRKSAVLRPA